MLGLVLPSNSPGVHTLWLPIIPLQIGLVLKPGPQEPWTPYRMAEAFFAAGIPREAISIYPGAGRRRRRGARQLRAQPDLRRHADGRSLSRQPPSAGARARASRKSCSATIRWISWERYLDVMVESVFINSGRSCINCSGIWASRHTREIADAIAERLAAVRPLPPDHPEAALAAFTVPGVADAISQSIDADLQAPGVTDVTASISRRCARRQGGTRRLPAADGRALRLAGRGRGEEGVHVPVRDGRGVSRVADARGDRSDAGLQRHHLQRGLPAAVARRRAHRSSESRSRADHAAQLAPAARRQHRRVPVPRAGVSDGSGRQPRSDCQVAMRDPVSITAGAAGMYCGSCFRDNALARGAARARATT